MRRRRSAPPDSLELLLDTICNTFGGVLFLAILIAVLVRTSSKIQERSTDEAPPATPVSAAEWYKAEADLQRTLTEQEALLKAIERQTALLAEIAGPEVKRSLEQQNNRDQERRRVLEDQRAALDALAKLQEQVDALAAEVADLDEALAKLPAELDAAKKELEKQKGLRTQSSRMSRVRSTSKDEVGVILRYGRLYVWHRYDNSGNRLGVNTDDMLIVGDDGEEYEVVPKPFAGAVVSADPIAGAAVSRVLARFNPKTEYLAVVIYPDSFEQFAPLKKLLIERDLEYRLIPANPGDPIKDQGGKGGSVQ